MIRYTVAQQNGAINAVQSMKAVHSEVVKIFRREANWWTEALRFISTFKLFCQHAVRLMKWHMSGSHKDDTEGEMSIQCNYSTECFQLSVCRNFPLNM